jgi:hypothetical protein
MSFSSVITEVRITNKNTFVRTRIHHECLLKNLVNNLNYFSLWERPREINSWTTKQKK